jgi:hypothetical protein
MKNRAIAPVGYARSRRRGRLWRTHSCVQRSHSCERFLLRSVCQMAASRESQRLAVGFSPLSATGGASSDRRQEARHKPCRRCVSGTTEVFQLRYRLYARYRSAASGRHPERLCGPGSVRTPPKPVPTRSLKTEYKSTPLNQREPIRLALPSAPPAYRLLSGASKHGSTREAGITFGYIRL